MSLKWNQRMTMRKRECLCCLGDCVMAQSKFSLFFFVYVVYNLSESEAVELETVLGLQ